MEFTSEQKARLKKVGKKISDLSKNAQRLSLARARFAWQPMGGGVEKWTNQGEKRNPKREFRSKSKSGRWRYHEFQPAASLVKEGMGDTAGAEKSRAEEAASRPSRSAKNDMLRQKLGKKGQAAARALIGAVGSLDKNPKKSASKVHEAVKGLSDMAKNAPKGSKEGKVARMLANELRGLRRVLSAGGAIAAPVLKPLKKILTAVAKAMASFYKGATKKQSDPVAKSGVEDIGRGIGDLDRRDVPVTKSGDVVKKVGGKLVNQKNVSR